MKLRLLTLTILLLSPSVFADQYINGYSRKDGTYVQPHYRSDNDGNSFNNYSTRGNTNPYTGSKGYEDPYKSNDNSIYKSNRGNIWGQDDE